NACIFKTVFEILFGGYATPTKCVAFWRLALNSYLDLFYFFRLFFIPFDSIFNSLYSKKKADKVHCNQVNFIHFLLSFYFSGQLTIFCKT
ncbi:MAG: hypothetical protein KHZ89_06925, partial [Lachnospiraceae bacterium]|nr:hypothetical protein [Lachnospiraceae bacterium]